MTQFSTQALDAYYNGDLDGTALGKKIRSNELEAELQMEYFNGDLN